MDQYLALLLFTLLFRFVSTIAPGGATTLVTASGVHFGFWRSLPWMTGAAGSFAALASGPARLALILGLAFGVSAGLSLAIWCMAGQMARVIKRGWQWRALNVALGPLLLASIIRMWR